MLTRGATGSFTGRAGGVSISQLLGGHIEVCVCSLGIMQPLVQAKTGRVIGLASDQRWDQEPEVPTMKEQGVPVSIVGLYIFALPKGAMIAVEPAPELPIAISQAKNAWRIAPDATARPPRPIAFNPSGGAVAFPTDAQGAVVSVADPAVVGATDTTAAPVKGPPVVSSIRTVTGTP